MKQSNRILAYSALALVVMLAAFGAIAFDTSNVAYAQGVPDEPTLTATASGADTIDLSWNAVETAARYELWAWDSVNEWDQLDDGSLTGTSHSHTGLTSGTTYYYQIRAVNSDGAAGGWSDRVNEVAGDMVPDEPVLTATAGFQQIEVSWPAATGAERYELWAWDSSWSQLDGGAADPLTATSFVHDGLTTGRTYYYQGRAVNSAGVMSAWSAQVSATVLSAPNISAPTSFSAARGDGQVTLTWSAPSSLAGLTIASYQYRHRESGGTFDSWTDAGNDGTKTVTGLTNGTTYDFELQAVSTTQAIGDSASDSATPSAFPGVPTSFTASATHRSVTLSWGAPANNGGAQVTSYRIEFLNSQSLWETIATRPASVTSYTDGSRTRSTEYQYRIHAINAAGEGSAASTSIFTTANAPEKPAAPQAVTATAVTVENGGGKIDLSWAAPVYNGGSAITAYYYRFKESEASSYGGYINAGQMDDGSGPNTSITVERGLTPGKTYIFQVAAQNAIGRSDPTTSGAAMVLSTAPTAAPVIRATSAALVDAGLSVPEGSDQVRIDWDGLGSADDGDGDNTSNIISGYTLQWKSSRDADPDNDPDTTKWPDDDEAVDHDQVVSIGKDQDNAGLYTYVHMGINQANNAALLPGATYTYRVRAVNEVGGVSRGGPWSVEKTSTTPANTPDAPAAAPEGEGVDADSIKVDWDAPTNDGGAVITSYELQVRTVNNEFIDPDNPEKENTGNTLITNLVASRTEYVHDGVRADVDYFYRVRAVNSAGKGAWSLANIDGDPFTTASAVAGTPGVPASFFAGNPSDAGSVVLTWTAPDANERPISSYDIQIQRVDDNDDNAADILDWSDATTVQAPPTVEMYTHRNAAGEATYNYRIRAVSGKGAGNWTDNDVAVTFDAREPSKPELTATATGPNDILLEWNVPQNNGTPIIGFHIQRWDTDAWANVGTDLDDQVQGHQSAGPTQTIFTDSGRDSGTKYYYRIRALPGTDAAGWSATDDTDAASATTQTGTPGQPQLFAAAGTPNPDANDPATTQVVGSITLTWDAPASNGGSDLTGYEIQVLDIETRTWVDEATVADDVETYTDTGLDPGKRYYYILRAVNADGPGSWTAFISSNSGVGPPEAPELTATTASRSSIDLSWTVPADNGMPITGYEIWQWNPDPDGNADTDDADWVETNLLTGNRISQLVTEFTVSELQPGTKYYYRIRALTEAAGDVVNGAWSAEDADDAASATTQGAVPQAPTALSAAVGTGTAAGTVDLEWTPPTGAAVGGSDIISYSVQRYNSETNMWDVVATPAHNAAAVDQTHTDRELTRGISYYYRVAAVNGQGIGEYIGYVATNAVVPPDLPDTPTLVATATGPYSIRLTWNIPADNGNAITGFQLQKWMLDPEEDTDTTPQWMPVDLAPADTGTNNGAATQTFYVDTDLIPNERYDYQIHATTANTPSLYGPANATTHVGAPGRSVATATVDGETAIKLTWDEPADNGSPINHYEIWMWDTTTKTWGWNGVAGGVHNVSHPLTTFTHSPLDAGTQIIYRVRAVNDATDNNGVGQWSTIVAGRTKEAAE